jgi:hypothetical protein
MTAPRLRQLALTLHVLASVGWFGAVAAFMALALTALTTKDPLALRGACVAMDLLARLLILPLCLGSLLTGVVQSLISHWGLLRHYWVAFKLLLNALSTIVLLGHMRPIAEVAQVAQGEPLGLANLYGTRLQILLDAAAALVVLIVATALAVYKPRGVTPYGWRRMSAR